jgi:hypothetical protein
VADLQGLPSFKVDGMNAAAEPFIDARTWEGGERRSALVSFGDADVMFTASWDQPSSLVPRPDGSYRRKYLVSLQLTSEHRERSFHQINAVTLFLLGEHAPLETDDIGGVHSRELHSVTLAMYIDDWRPREPQSAIVTKPSRG